MNMEKYTKKQRKEIYLKAAEILDLKLNSPWCICGALDTIGIPYGHKGITDSYKLMFPEFALFEPAFGVKVWFGVFGGDSYTERVTCLLLCAQMCDNP